MMTPRKTISGILKQITVLFPDIQKAKDRPNYVLHTNGVVEELNERIALAERDISLPASYGHRGRSFIIDEIDARIRLDRTETYKLYKESYCKKRGAALFDWMLSNVPHGIFKAFGEQFAEHWNKIKQEEISYDIECNTGE